MKKMQWRSDPGRWIDGDESAAEMLARVLIDRPSLLVPPLHRIPLRVGNVVEIVGPSASAKTQILIQAAVNCILPKEWNGVYYGGLDRSVMFIDLDCRFDVLRLSQVLKLQILKANESFNKEGSEQSPDVSELYNLCMKQFLFVRCYDSFEFLATLKTLHHRLQIEKEHGMSIHLLMIDSIGAFHWIDRASSLLQLGGNNRKTHSLQSVTEAIVQEIRKILLVHPIAVIATKSTILGDRSVNVVKRNTSLPDTSDFRNAMNISQQVPYREYMPPIWQSFVTHRVLVRASDTHHAMSHRQIQSIFLSEWLLPYLGFSDEFIVKDAGVCLA